MPTRFNIEYDDFSGGYWVGRRHSEQPRHTWEGTDLVAEQGTGFLMPTGRWVEDESGAVVWGPLAMDEEVCWAADPTGTDLHWFEFADTWPPTISDIDTSGTGVIPSGPAVLFDGKFVVFGLDGGGINTYVVYAEAFIGAVATAAVVPTIFEHMVAYDSWIMAADAFNRIYYCEPYDVTSWPVSNFYDIGNFTDTINTMVVHNGQLYIGTDTGWYIGAGVPGETFSVRRLNFHHVPGVAGSADGDYRMLCTAPTDSLLREVSGNAVAAVNYRAELGVPQRVGHLVCVSPQDLAATGGQNEGDLWSFDLTTGAWARFSPCGAAAHYANGLGSTGEFWIGVDASALFRYELYPTNCGFDDATDQFYEATALLAEYARATPFRVDEAIAEIELDDTATDATRTLKLSILTRGHLDIDIETGDAAQSVEQTHEWNLSGAGQVAVVKFIPNDGLVSYLAQPQVKLAGVKLRRLILRCTEVV